MHIIFAGGGTAGHINPAIAIAGYIRQRHPDAKISFIGNGTGMESKLAPQAGFDFYGINVAGFQRKISLKNIGRNLAAGVKMFTSTIEASRLLKELKPEMVVGTGGYVSGPVVSKAAKMRIPTVIQEQNALPGVTTKMLAPMVNAVLLAMPEAKKYIKSKNPPIISGNPVREELIQADRDESRSKLGLDDRPLILSYGGSLGARKINEAIVGVMKWHNKDAKYYHYHATGKFGIKWMPQLLKESGVDLDNNPQIHLCEYIENMSEVMAACDLVISRAGAITLSEIQAKGKASILIPSPNVSENHQYHNAMALVLRGAAIVVEEKDLTPKLLCDKIASILDNPQKREEMESAAKQGAILDSNAKIYKVIIGLLDKK